MAKIRTTIGVIGVTLCLFVVIYGDIYTVARRDALRFVAAQGGIAPALIPGMIRHAGIGNRGAIRYPNRIDALLPPGYAYYEFYAPFNNAFRPRANKGQRRVILALRRTDGRVHPTWYHTSVGNHYKKYFRRVTNSRTK